MFKRLSTGDTITFYYEDTPVSAHAGESVAAALLASGYTAIRQSHVSTTQRGPYCMMGACYECLVQHEGKSVQACMLVALQGMHIRKVPAASATARQQQPDE